MVLRINPLTEGEIRTLTKICRYDSRCRWRLRAQILLQANEGFTSPAIAVRVGCHPSTARRWLRRWNQKGLEAFQQADRMMDQQTTQRRCQALKQLLHHPPSQLDLPFTTWTCRTIAAFYREVVGVPWKPQQVWYYLKKAGLRYRKTETRFTTKPLGYDLWKASKRLLDQYLPSDTLLLYLDEKGPCRATRYGGYCWSQQCVRLDVRQPVHGKIFLLGAYDPQADRIWLIPMDHKDSGEFCDAVTKLWVQLDHRPWKRLIFILDNASYHRSQYTQSFLNNLPNCSVIFLPPYSPELNPIEQRFRQYTKEVLELGTFSSADDLLLATTAWEQYYNTFRAQIYGLGGVS